MTHASLFSGIGGSEVAAAMLGMENSSHCEINPFGRKVLEYWFPNSKSYEDITKQNFEEWRGKIDILTGGFPCQPFSYAGKRGGADDDRYLWPHMLRAIQEIRPTWVIGENVAGITTMVEQSEIVEVGEQTALFGAENTLRSYELRQRFTLERICQDLEGVGYSVQPLIVPACSVGAPHRRDRVFIVAHSNECDDQRGSGLIQGEEGAQPIQERNNIRESGDASDARSKMSAVPQDLMRSGQFFGLNGEQGSERNERHTCPGDSQRVCRETSRTASSDSDGNRSRTSREGEQSQESRSNFDAEPDQRQGQTERIDGLHELSRNIADTNGEMLERRKHGDSQGHRKSENGSTGLFRSTCNGTEFEPGWRWKDFPTVSPIHRGNDGIPFDVDKLSIPFSRWREESIKAYGNAIVPQVMYELFLAIKTLQQ